MHSPRINENLLQVSSNHKLLLEAKEDLHRQLQAKEREVLHLANAHSTAVTELEQIKENPHTFLESLGVMLGGSGALMSSTGTTGTRGDGGEDSTPTLKTSEGALMTVFAADGAGGGAGGDHHPRTGGGTMEPAVVEGLERAISSVERDPTKLADLQSEISTFVQQVSVNVDGAAAALAAEVSGGAEAGGSAAQSTTGEDLLLDDLSEDALALGRTASAKLEKVLDGPNLELLLAAEQAARDGEERVEVLRKLEAAVGEKNIANCKELLDDCAKLEIDAGSVGEFAR